MDDYYECCASGSCEVCGGVQGMIRAQERLREIGNRICPLCCDDVLRRDYTASDRCHAQRWPE